MKALPNLLVRSTSCLKLLAGYSKVFVNSPTLSKSIVVRCILANPVSQKLPQRKQWAQLSLELQTKLYPHVCRFTAQPRFDCELLLRRARLMLQCSFVLFKPGAHITFNVTLPSAACTLIRRASTSALRFTASSILSLTSILETCGFSVMLLVTPLTPDRYLTANSAPFLSTNQRFLRG